MGVIPYRETFGRKLTRMFHDFQFVERPFTLTATYRTFLLPDPRRIYVAVLGQWGGILQMEMRFIGSTSPVGQILDFQANWQYVWTAEFDYNAPQIGMEGFTTDVNPNIIIREILYRGG